MKGLDAHFETQLRQHQAAIDEADELEALHEQIEELKDALYLALPFVEDHEGNPAYKAGAVNKALKRIREALGE